MTRSPPGTSADKSKLSEINGVKVFTATKSKDRELLGDLITDWIRDHPDFEILDKVVTQSSDSAYHCLTITLFYKQPRP